MLKYLTAESIVKKHKTDGKGKTDAEKEKRKRYEDEVRRRAFHKHWQVGRSWLKYESEKNMWCEDCREFNKNPLGTLHPGSLSWLIGTSNLRIDAIKTHKTFVMHNDT